MNIEFAIASWAVVVPLLPPVTALFLGPFMVPVTMQFRLPWLRCTCAPSRGLGFAWTWSQDA